MINDT
ncbi:hypothetical protein PGANDO_0909, partial [Porphyromonas gingivalis]